MAVDLAQPEDITSLIQRQTRELPLIDVLICNAGSLPGKSIVRDQDGFDVTFVNSLLGHHRLVMGLLQHGCFAKHSTILIAGSESASGTVPLMNPANVQELADQYYAGEISVTLEAIMRADQRLKLSRGSRYATAKLFVAWWSASLSRRLPEGMRVFTISPGNTFSTDIARHQHWLLQKLHAWCTPHLARLSGQAASTRQAALRYLEAISLPDEESGTFFARGVAPP